MANEKNLVPNEKRTPSERRRIAQKAGRASGEARRAKKTMKEYAEFLLSLPVTDGRKFNKLSRMGVPVEGIDNKMLMVAALMQAAQSGDVQAAKEMRSIIGEDRQQDMTDLEKLDSILCGINEVMNRD